MQTQIVEQPDGSLTLSVDSALYDNENVLKTAHIFTDRCYIQISPNDKEIAISFRSKESDIASLRLVVDNFCNELIDQQARAIVSRECAYIRDQIVKKAFSPIE